MRVVDKDKIKRVKAEAKKLIVEKGYHGASIAELARRADVSDGYLYRFHKNKKDMVSFLFENQLEEIHDRVFELLDTKNTIREIVYEIIKKLYDLDEKEPHAIRFLNCLLYDFEFEYPKSRAKAISEFMPRIMEMGYKTGEFQNDVRAVDIMTLIFIVPSKQIEYKRIIPEVSFQSLASKSYTKEEEIELLTKRIMNSLK